MGGVITPHKLTKGTPTPHVPINLLVPSARGCTRLITVTFINCRSFQIQLLNTLEDVCLEAETLHRLPCEDLVVLSTSPTRREWRKALDKIDDPVDRAEATVFVFVFVTLLVVSSRL